MELTPALTTYACCQFCQNDEEFRADFAASYIAGVQQELGAGVEVEVVEIRADGVVATKVTLPTQEAILSRVAEVKDALISTGLSLLAARMAEDGFGALALDPDSITTVFLAPAPSAPPSSTPTPSPSPSPPVPVRADSPPTPLPEVPTPKSSSRAGLIAGSVIGAVVAAAVVALIAVVLLRLKHRRQQQVSVINRRPDSSEERQRAAQEALIQGEEEQSEPGEVPGNDHTSPGMAA